MKYPTEKSKKYPGLEQLSTAELEDLLRRDFATSEDDDASMALITEIMEVIQDREAQQELPVDEDTAWEMFLERNIRNAVTSNEEVPDMDKTQKTGNKKENKFHRKKWRWAASVAAVICLATCLFAPSAMAKDAVRSFVQWSAHTFSISLGEVSPFYLDSATYDQMKQKTEELTELPVLPTAYPKGAELIQIEECSGFNDETRYFIFSSSQGGFSINVTVYDSLAQAGTSIYEKNNGPVEKYYSHNICHYIAKNIDTYIAVWFNGNVECFIQGNLSEDDIKMMIDSIYE